MTAEGRDTVEQDVLPASIGPAPLEGAAGVELDGADYRVRVLYFIPSNRTPLPGYEERVDAAMRLIQTFYRNNMEMAGYGPKTFRLELDARGKVVTHLYNAPETDAYYREGVWGRVRTELGTHPVWSDRSTTVLVVIVETYIIHPDGTGEGGPALGAQDNGGSGGWGGMAMVGGHELFYLSPYYFSDTTPGLLVGFEPVHCRGYLGKEIVSKGVKASSSIGGIAHEMGHAFGLPHDFRHGDRYLMGNGFRRFARAVSPHTAIPPALLSDCSAGALNHSRFFADESAEFTDNEDPVALITSPQEGSTFDFGSPVTLVTEAHDPGDAGLAFSVYTHGNKGVQGCGDLSGNSATPAFTYPTIPAGTDKFRIALIDSQGCRGGTSRDDVSLNVLDTPSGPDLQPGLICYDPPETAGGEVSVTIRVANRGNGPALVPHRADWYRDETAPPGTFQLGDLFTTFGPIAPGWAISETVGSFTYTSGVLRTALQVDVWNDVDEFEEGVRNVAYPILYGHRPCHSLTEVSGLRVSKEPSGVVGLGWDPSPDPCHRSYKVYASPSPQPDTLPGAFPFDPSWAEITGADLDAQAANTYYSYRPPPEIRYYLVLSEGGSGNNGPSGHY